MSKKKEEDSFEIQKLVRDAAKHLPDRDRLTYYELIFEYALNQVITVKILVIICLHSKYLVNLILMLT